MIQIFLSGQIQDFTKGEDTGIVVSVQSAKCKAQAL